jgi:hypothetical protein
LSMHTIEVMPGLAMCCFHSVQQSARVCGFHAVALRASPPMKLEGPS